MRDFSPSSHVGRIARVGIARDRRAAPASLLTLAMASAVAAAMWLGAASPAAADGALETETARLLEAGRWEVGSAVEFQTSSNGQEIAVPTSITYGVTRRLEFLVEPVLFTSIQSAEGAEGGEATGIGDVEATLMYLLRDETPCLPAFAIAGEVKIPSASNRLIGTRETDVSAYLIASRRIGRFDFHANAGYTFVGQPSGEELSNTFHFALAAEFCLTPRFDLIAEALATTASSESGGESSTNPEASGGEFVGTLGVRFHASECLALFADVSYDNRDAFSTRLGFSLKF